MTCEVIQTECLRVGDRVPITLDFSQVAARHWRAGASFATGDKIRGNKSGYQFEATTGGQTGNKEPNWPKTLNTTIEDGSVVWTVKAVAVDSLGKILTSVAWTVPTGLTKSGEAINTTKQTAVVYLEAITIGVYAVIAFASFDDTPTHKEGYQITEEVE